MGDDEVLWFGVLLVMLLTAFSFFMAGKSISEREVLIQWCQSIDMEYVRVDRVGYCRNADEFQRIEWYDSAN